MRPLLAIVFVLIVGSGIFWLLLVGYGALRRKKNDPTRRRRGSLTEDGGASGDAGGF